MRFVLFAAILVAGSLIAGPADAIICLEGTQAQCAERNGVRLRDVRRMPDVAMVVQYVPVAPVVMSGYPVAGWRPYWPDRGANIRSSLLRHNRSLFLWRDGRHGHRF
jgi:hypothetical protein